MRGSQLKVKRLNIQETTSFYVKVACNLEPVIYSISTIIREWKLVDYANASLLLKRPVTVKAIVTTRWKEEVRQQLQNEIAKIDNQIEQLELQGKRTLEEIQKQGDKTANPQIGKQIESIQSQVNKKKSEFLDKKNQFLQQLQQIQLLELDQEVVQAQMESFFRLEQGDNLVKKLNVEVVIRDGIVEEIRGEL